MDKSAVGVVVAPQDERYGAGHLGLSATRSFSAGEVVLYEVPLVYVSAAIGTQEKEKLDEYAKMFSPPGSHLAWLAPDSQYQLGGKSSYLVQSTVRMIMHHEIKSKAIVEEKCRAYMRFRDPSRTTPSPLAYAVFREKSKDHDHTFWDLANFERLYVYMSHRVLEADLCCTSMSIGAGYCEVTSLLNHSCKPNAVAKLLPNKMFITALCDIAEGEEVTVAYEPTLLGFALPDRIAEYNKSKLGFLCKCGHCDKAPLPYGYEEGEVSKEYGEEATTLLRSFCSEPKGKERLGAAEALLAEHSSIFQGGSKEYDITVAHILSAGILECVHESGGLVPTMELADVLECAGRIMLECTEINRDADPIWILRATFGQLQVAQTKLLEAVGHSMMFKREKEEEAKKGTKLSPEELAIDQAFAKEVHEKIREHLYGFLSNYLLYKEASSIVFGHLVGPLVVTIELATCPSLESIVLSHAEDINKIQAQVGVDAYRKYKANLSPDRYKNASDKDEPKLCKDFLMGECKRGNACTLVHDEQLKSQLY